MTYRTKALLVGTLFGALIGAVLAWTATDGQPEGEEATNPLANLGPSDYLQLGIAILTLGRQFGSMLKTMATLLLLNR